jgi:NADH-quinone oxidoreductase subunit M
MQTPIIILSVAVILFGIFPGLILKFINNLGVSIGFQKFNISIMGISTETGILNMLNISFLFLLSIAAVFILFKIGKKSRKVSQEDNYAAGAPIPEGKYHYTVEFYAPLYKMISKYLKDIVDIFYYWVAGIVESLCNVVRKIYSGDIRTYVGYILLFLAVLIYIYLG